jgi:hypothetical protein
MPDVHLAGRSLVWMLVPSRPPPRRQWLDRGRRGVASIPAVVRSSSCRPELPRAARNISDPVPESVDTTPSSTGTARSSSTAPRTAHSAANGSRRTTQPAPATSGRTPATSSRTSGPSARGAPTPAKPAGASRRPRRRRERAVRTGPCDLTVGRDRAGVPDGTPDLESSASSAASVPHGTPEDRLGGVVKGVNEIQNRSGGVIYPIQNSRV